MSVPDECKDPDLRDLDEETPPPESERPRSGVAIRVRRGSFNDGWVEVIGLLAETLTEEQHTLLQARFAHLMNRGPNVR